MAEHYRPLTYSFTSRQPLRSASAFSILCPPVASSCIGVFLSEDGRILTDQGQRPFMASCMCSCQRFLRRPAIIISTLYVNVNSSPSLGGRRCAQEKKRLSPAGASPPFCFLASRHVPLSLRDSQGWQ